MKIMLRWLGIIVIGLWVITFLVAATMMWHPTWMSTEHTPVSEIYTNAFHFSAVLMGVCLGPMLFFKAIKSQLSSFQKASYVLVFFLALITISPIV